MKKDFSIRLKRCLDLRGKRATDVALNCGFSRGMMSNYLNGKRMPKYERIFDIANYLNVNPAYLMGISDNIITTISQPLNTLSNEKSKKELIIEEISANLTFLDIDTLNNLNIMISSLAKDKKH